MYCALQAMIAVEVVQILIDEKLFLIQQLFEVEQPVQAAQFLWQLIFHESSAFVSSSAIVSSSAFVNSLVSFLGKVVQLLQKKKRFILFFIITCLFYTPVPFLFSFCPKFSSLDLYLLPRVPKKLACCLQAMHACSDTLSYPDT